MMKERILIAGGSGLIGKNLYRLLTSSGYEVLILSRNKKLAERPDFICWDPEKKILESNDDLRVSSIINLCGAGIAEKKWSKARKEELIASRVRPAAFLGELVASGRISADTYIGASAIGIYGDRPGKDICRETDPVSEATFLGRCCVLWETAHEEIPDTVRKIIMRIGIVLAAEGGALEQYRPLLALRMSPYFGGGKPYMSWVTVDDVCRQFLFAIQNKTVQGIYNVAGDQPVTSKEFAKAFIRSQGKWAVARRVPGFAVRLMLGEMASVVLESQYVSNEKIKSAGFRYNSHNIGDAFKSLNK